jgi:hypothetical protein
VPSSELETARRNRGGPPSLLLEDEDELPDELLLDELLAVLLDELSSELELARRSLGRSRSLSLDELEELLEELSSELADAARRKVGLLGFEPTEELLFELFEEDEDDDDELSDDLGSGFMSSVCSEASECSSVVPSRTMEIVVAL